MWGRKKNYQLYEDDDETSMLPYSSLGDSNIAVASKSHDSGTKAPLNESNAMAAPEPPVFTSAETNDGSDDLDEVEHLLPSDNEKDWSEQQHSFRHFPASSTPSMRRLEVSKVLKKSATKGNTRRKKSTLQSLAKKVSHQQDRHRTFIEVRGDSFGDYMSRVANPQEVRDGPPHAALPQLAVSKTSNESNECFESADAHSNVKFSQSENLEATKCEPRETVESAGPARDLEKDSEMKNDSSPSGSPRSAVVTKTTTNTEAKDYPGPSCSSADTTDTKTTGYRGITATSIATDTDSEKESASSSHNTENTTNQDYDGQRAFEQLVASATKSEPLSSRCYNDSDALEARKKGSAADLNTDAREHQPLQSTGSQNKREECLGDDAVVNINADVVIKKCMKQESNQNKLLSQTVGLSPTEKKLVSFSQFEDVRYYIQETFTDLVSMSVASRSSVDDASDTTDGMEEISHYSSTDSEREQQKSKEQKEGCLWTSFVLVTDLQGYADDFMEYAEELKHSLDNIYPNFDDPSREPQTTREI